MSLPVWETCFILLMNGIPLHRSTIIDSPTDKHLMVSYFRIMNKMLLLKCLTGAQIFIPLVSILGYGMTEWYVIQRCSTPMSTHNIQYSKCLIHFIPFLFNLLVCFVIGSTASAVLELGQSSGAQETMWFWGSILVLIQSLLSFL